MTDSYARVKPLVKCSHASCGRGDKTCRKLAAGKTCLKTHFATYDDWDKFMCAGFDDLDKFTVRIGKFSEEEGWTIDAMFHALCERIDDRRPAKESNVH